MVFQDYALYPQMSVRKNLAFGLKMRKLPKPEIARRVEEAAALLELDQLLERKPRELSGGQRQRVALGRALVRDPQVFLMDEPLSNLDAKLRAKTRADIRALQQRVGITTVYVTHDQVEAMTMGDRIAIMRNGVIEQCGDPGRGLRAAGEHVRRGVHRQPGDEPRARGRRAPQRLDRARARRHAPVARLRRGRAGGRDRGRAARAHAALGHRARPDRPARGQRRLRRGARPRDAVRRDRPGRREVRDRGRGQRAAPSRARRCASACGPGGSTCSTPPTSGRSGGSSVGASRRGRRRRAHRPAARGEPRARAGPRARRDRRPASRARA